MKSYCVFICIFIKWFLAFELVGQCIVPIDIAFRVDEIYGSDFVVTDSNMSNRFSKYYKTHIDTTIGRISHSVLPFLDIEGDSLFTGVIYTKCGLSEYYFYYEKGVENGPLFFLRKDGFYATGICRSGECDILEYYPNGNLFAKYSTVELSLKIGKYIAFNIDGQSIYEAEFRIEPYSGENLDKAFSNYSDDLIKLNSRYIQIMVDQYCPESPSSLPNDTSATA